VRVKKGRELTRINSFWNLSSIQADIRKDPDIQPMMKDVTEQLGTIDVLVNNADSQLHQMKEE
jgi:NADP-dependent 3-hydroxy acid dehydrogenase YdfG